MSKKSLLCGDADLTEEECWFVEKFIDQTLLDVEEFIDNYFDNTDLITILYQYVRWNLPLQKQEQYFDNIIKENVNIQSMYMDYVSKTVESILSEHENELSAQQYDDIKAYFEDGSNVFLDNPVKEASYYFLAMKNDFLDNIKNYNSFVKLLLDERFKYQIRFTESQRIDPFNSGAYSVFYLQILTPNPLQELCNIFLNILYVFSNREIYIDQDVFSTFGRIHVLDDDLGFEFSNIFVEDTCRIVNEYPIFTSDDLPIDCTWAHFLCIENNPLLNYFEKVLHHYDNEDYWLHGQIMTIKLLRRNYMINYTEEGFVYIACEPVRDFFNILLNLYTECYDFDFLSVLSILKNSVISEINETTVLVFCGLTKEFVSFIDDEIAETELN